MLSLEMKGRPGTKVGLDMYSTLQGGLPLPIGTVVVVVVVVVIVVVAVVVGAVVCVVVVVGFRGSPNCPWSFLPQVRTLPSQKTAAENEFPQATCTGYIDSVPVSFIIGFMMS